MRGFRKLALITTGVTYFLIFIGGLVRVAGAGMGCPDWPKCFGRWIPPTSIDQLPHGLDPTTFNFTLAWIEYFNRLAGVLTGLLILSMAIYSIVKLREHKKLLWPTNAALVLVAFQGWQGGQVVALNLKPIVVSMHLVLALIIVSLLIYVSYYATQLMDENVGVKRAMPAKAKMWIVLTYGLGILTILLGTQLRSALEVIRDNFTAMSESNWLASVGMIKHIHMTLGLITAGLGAHLGAKVMKRAVNPTSLVLKSAIGLMGLMTLQIVIGVVMLVWNMPALMQLFHLWIASIFVGLVLILYLADTNWGEVSNES
ncbi:MAG TPA: hypothetical protein DHU63_07705 [Candidatus Marinimicrobia bacterium]|nr:MAG: hypothetical protein COY19_03310 [Candidatus Marinimicrobia bacterium CG_4_10_14_0_2_um_filter_48_9]PJA55081.1 MAG: hypothetical protein CO167_00175 [Candidatus Marinimicrobia bacterium CG_4_9_14_3_um_filter_48_9]HCW76406.1 hypothetical protein [Candidatus Neomarinimicrobiota bacterium]